MATDVFKDGAEGDYASGTSWLSGVAPAAGDTLAVLTSDLIADPGPRFGQVDAYGVTYPSVSPARRSAPGEAVSGQTVDLVGGGGLVGVVLRNSTLAADTVTHVSGHALLEGQLDGLISIGTPFDIDDIPVTAPTPTSSAVPATDPDIVVSALSSWNENSQTGVSTASGYTPSVTNKGTIEIAADSALRVSPAAQAGCPAPARRDTRRQAARRQHRLSARR